MFPKWFCQFLQYEYNVNTKHTDMVYKTWIAHIESKHHHCELKFLENCLAHGQVSARSIGLIDLCDWREQEYWRSRGKLCWQSSIPLKAPSPGSDLFV